MSAASQRRWLWRLSSRSSLRIRWFSQTRTHLASSLELEIWAWGRGEAGQLGHGAESMESSPVLIMELRGQFSALAPVSGLLKSSLISDLHHSQALLQRSSQIFEAQSCEKTNSGSVTGNLTDVDKLDDPVSNAGGGSVGIAAGLFHSMAWENGNLWVWGKGDGGRLGLGSEDPKYFPTLNKNIENVSSVALGGLHSVALLNDGEVYTWGYGGLGGLGHGVYTRELVPRHLQYSWEGKVMHISAGASHTAAVTDCGIIYTWGRDEGDGRLGHINMQLDEGVLSSPKRVDLSVRFATVCCGGFFTMALTPEGELWGWGGNSNYELGRGSKSVRGKPMPVPDLQNTRISQVSCGGYHSAALTEDGKVLTWGFGGHGQLGHGSINSVKVPTIVEALEDEHIVYIACGSSWTAAITDSGTVFTWGKNRDCQIGVPGLSDIQTVPIAIHFSSGSDNNENTSRKMIAVCAGSNHGLGLAVRLKA